MTDPSPDSSSPATMHKERGREQFAGSAEAYIVSPAARETFVIAIGQDGQIVSYGSRAVLLNGRKAG